MKKFDVKKLTFGELSKKVTLPSYQRTFVWSKQKKEDLISTIKKGLPIGTILLSEKQDGYQIIDGLQRIATMKDFQKNPYIYLEEEEITDAEVVEILTITDDSAKNFNDFKQHSKNKTIEDTKKLLIENIKNIDQLNINEKAFSISEILIKNTSILNENAKIDIQPKIYRILDKIIKILDIENYEIPGIVFKGSDSEAVEVFTLLNSKGTKLSKYDVFSAKWSNIEIENIDDEIINIIMKKYETSIEKSGVEVSNYSPTKFKDDKVVNVFEYAFAIGKLIGEKSKLMFKTKEDDLVDSLGFTVLAGIFNISNKEMYKLSKCFQNTDIDYNNLKDGIINVTQNIEKVLSEYISSHEKKRNYSSHTEFQLASYIITLFRLKYSLTDGKYVKTKQFNKETNKFKENLPMHYMYDIYRNYWRGSGDTALDQLIIDAPSVEYNHTIKNSRYLFKVDKKDFESSIRTWINEENAKNKSNISKETKLFHCCIVNKRLNKTDSYKMDFDHIVPKNKFKYLENGSKNGIPVSSPCNITMIPEFDNRGKKEITYYEYEESSSGLIRRYEQEELDKFNYPRREELEFVNNKKLNKEEYLKFIDERKDKIVKDFVNVFF